MYTPVTALSNTALSWKLLWMYIHVQSLACYSFSSLVISHALLADLRRIVGVCLSLMQTETIMVDFQHQPWLFKKERKSDAKESCRTMLLLLNATQCWLITPATCLLQIDDDRRKDSTYFRHRGRYDKKVQTTKKSDGHHRRSWSSAAFLTYLFPPHPAACHLEGAEANGWRFQRKPEDRAQHCKTGGCRNLSEHENCTTRNIYVLWFCIVSLES